MKRFEIVEKFNSSKTLLKVADAGMHTQHIPHPPGSTSGCISRKDGLSGGRS